MADIGYFSDTGDGKGSPVITVENLSFMYDTDPVLKDMNFVVHRGDFVAIIGPNGAGKSTLAKLILGLLKPHVGTILVGGVPPVKASRSVGYIPQYSTFDPTFPVRVKDVVLMGRLVKPFGFYSREDRRAAYAALEETAMEEFANRPFGALSGGQRQRVLIARALAGNPEILLMDEPTTNVDAAAEQRMRHLLKHLNERMTVLLITHDLGFVPEMVNKVLCVNVFAKLHETNEVTAEMIQTLFRTGVRMVDHRHPEPETGPFPGRPESMGGAANG